MLRLLNEPTAAAIAYGLDNAAEGVCGLRPGGGTFDVSILRLTQGVFEVISTGGDTALGGDDFDALIADHAASGLGSAELPPADRRALLVAARAAREALSDADDARLRLTLSDGRELDFALSRQQFESLAQPLVLRTLDCARRALRDAELRPADVRGVVMGGPRACP